MAIVYDVYINDAPLAGHTDLTEAQLLNIDRVLNTSYPVGTNLKVQVMAKDGALTSLSDAVNLVVPVASGTTFSETFTATNGTTLDPAKWAEVKVASTTAGTNAVIENNELKMTIGTANGSAAAIQETYKTQFNFATTNIIKWRVALKTPVAGSFSSNGELALTGGIPVASTNGEQNVVRISTVMNNVLGKVQVYLQKKISGGSLTDIVPLIEIPMTTPEFQSGITADFDLQLSADSLLLKRNGITIAEVTSGLGLSINSAYPTLKASNAGTTIGQNDVTGFDNLYFVNP